MSKRHLPPFIAPSTASIASVPCSSQMVTRRRCRSGQADAPWNVFTSGLTLDRARSCRGPGLAEALGLADDRQQLLALQVRAPHDAYLAKTVAVSSIARGARSWSSGCAA